MSLLDDALLVNAELDAFLAASARDAKLSLTDLLSTDDNLYLEYATPRGNVLPPTESQLLWSQIQRFRGDATARRLRAP
jgi:spermidine synthase